MPPTIARRVAAEAPAAELLHPLARLRSVIRTYVLLDAVLFVLLFLTSWFWLGIGLDWGLFALTGVDLVQSVPAVLRWLVTGFLAALMVSLLLLRGTRLLRQELSDNNLALLLEKRYPQLLGDRLITSLEMADVDAAVAQGYSRDMVRKTIADARERVGQVKVGRVFNWKRLWLKLFLILGVSLVALGSGLGFYWVGEEPTVPGHYGAKVTDVAHIWTERHLTFAGTPWPRRAHIELTDFPETGELRVGKSANGPTIRARAYKWVVAAPGTRDGWRPLLWKDLTENTTIRGRTLDTPAPSLKNLVAVFSNYRPSTVSVEMARDQFPQEALDRVTADEVEFALGLDVDAEIAERLNNGETADDILASATPSESIVTVESLKHVFRRLNGLARQSAYSRTFRKLLVPRPMPVTDDNGETTMVEQPLTLIYVGKKTGAPVELARQATGEAAGQIAGLKESVFFDITFENYTTDLNRIVLVPPPMFTDFRSTDYHPAYLYHKAPGDDTAQLRGLKQVFAGNRLSLTGDVTEHLVPFGTEIEFTATTDKPLRTVKLIPKSPNLRAQQAGGNSRVVIGNVLSDIDRVTLTEMLKRFATVVRLDLPDSKGGLAREARAELTDFDQAAYDTFLISEQLAKVLTITGLPRRLHPDDLALTTKTVVEDRGEGEKEYPVSVVHFALRKRTRPDVISGQPVSVVEVEESINQLTEFDLEITDRDGVTATRAVKIRTTEDAPPDVKLAVDDLFKIGTEYWITPKARLPFSAGSGVTDNSGLSRVVFDFRWNTVESAAVAAAVTELAAPPATLAPTASVAPSPAATAVAAAATALALSLDSGAVQVQAGTFPVPRFERDYSAIPADTIDGLKRKLAQKFDGSYGVVRAVKLADGQIDVFDVEAALPALAVPEGQVQPRYLVRLNVTATDSNADRTALLNDWTCRRIAANTNVPARRYEVPAPPKTAAEATSIPLLIVSEGDLLVELSKKEDSLISKIDEAVKRVEEAKRKLAEQAGYLASPDPGIEALKNASVRSGDILLDVAKAKSICSELLTQYTNLATVLKVNRCNEALLKTYENPPLGGDPNARGTGYIDRLTFLLRGDPNPGPFQNTGVALDAFQAPLAATNPIRPTDAQTNAARGEVETLLRELKEFQSIAGQKSNIEAVINKLRGVLTAQEGIRDNMAAAIKELSEVKKFPRILSADQVTMKPGEARKIKLKIDWQLYRESEVLVNAAKVPADSDVEVPKELTLKEEQNATDFEIEVKAGQRTGITVIRLTPFKGRTTDLRIEVAK